MVKRLFILCLLLITAVPALAQEPGSTSLPQNYRLDLTNLRHLYQSLNNCGPATLTMGLSYFGYPAESMAAQTPAADYLKPARNDGNVAFWQMQDYVNNFIQDELGVKAVARRGGNLDLIKRLLANDFPVIMGKGLDVPGEGWVGHFVLAIGYDEAEQNLLVYDSFEGHGNLQGLKMSYASVIPLWQQFNNVFLVMYPVEREGEVETLLGDLWEEQGAWEQARTVAEANTLADPQDAWAWFNLGEALTFLGRYEEAVEAYNHAYDYANVRNRMPFRAQWYMHGIFIANYRAGNYEQVVRLAMDVQRNTANVVYIEDMDYYRGLVLAVQGDTEGALAKFEQVLEFNPNYYPAADAKAAVENGTFTAPVGE